MGTRLFGIKIITVSGMAMLTILAIGLTWFSGHSYLQLAEMNQLQTSQHFLKRETHRLLQSLYNKQKSFGYRLQNEKPFRQAMETENSHDIEAWLSLSFKRFDASNGLIHFRSILLRDVDGDLMAAAYEEDSTHYSGCPLIIDRIHGGIGTAGLKPKYVTCSHDKELMAEVVVSVGSLKPRAYLHIIAYVKDELKGLQKSFGFPLILHNADHKTVFESENWAAATSVTTLFKPVSYTLYGDDNVPGIIVSTIYDASLFMRLAKKTDVDIFLVTGLSIFVVLVIVLLLLFYVFRPVDKVGDSVGVLLNGHYAPISDQGLPFELHDIATSYNEMIEGLEYASQKRKVAENDLRSERDFISTTLDSFTNAVLVIDSGMIIKLVNPATETLLGECQENLIGYPIDELAIMYTNRSATHIVDLKKLLKTPHRSISLFYQRDIKTIELEMTASPMVDKASEEVGHVLIFRDVTEHSKLRRKLNYEGRHDKLTGLFNRRAFESKFDSMVGDIEYASNQHIMVYINLDQFKVVNETCGNIAGDELLKQVAATIQQNIRKSDILARLGGDEFGLLLPYAEAEAAANTVNDILTYVEQTGFNWNEKEYTVKVSAALIPFGQSSDNFSEKFSMLTSARYLVSQNGGNQYYLLDDDDQKVQEYHSSMGWVAGINKGITERRFKLYAQPIVPLTNLKDRQHYEILIRYQGEDGRIINPQEFLVPAERFNLIEKIDRWVVTETIHWLNKYKCTRKDIQFSINLSGRSVSSTNFHTFLKQMLTSKQVDPGCLCFELTETAAIQDVEKSIEFMKEIKKLGAKFSLDDFGSGLSSFTYLKQFPVDYLKIDGAFIKDILIDTQCYDIVRSITEVGHCLSMKVIAEFVESRHMIHLLREARVDYLQGYAIGKPKPIESIESHKEAVDG